MRLRIQVTGIVQGVGFRPFVYRIAVKNGLFGYVKNRGDAGVEILLEGTQRDTQRFLEDLKQRKPPLAQIYNIITSNLEGTNEYSEFAIKKSSDKIKLSGSVVPPDIAICDECLRELRNPQDPRFEYFFITCTNCGPRFTIIEKLPYDRKNTTMREFPMCSFCLKEYKDPLNRRFHAQTVACPNCGPRAYLTDSQGTEIEKKDPIREAGKLLSEGHILAIKGYGGFHIALSAIKPKPLIRLRKVKHRSQKPFAIMARSLKAVKTFAELNGDQAELLNSYPHPIVLLNKSRDYYLSDLIAPKLHNVGVMLPYTGTHHMLFDQVEDSSFVMTSANQSDQPIIKENDEALEKLCSTVDYFLFHNRRIAQRCDDSVVRIHDGNNVFIRRSRGYVPAPVKLQKRAADCVLAFGGELNNTLCILNGDKAFMSQHIGDVENIETRAFLENATKHLIHLTNGKVETVVCDLHPKFITTSFAQELAEENDWQILQIQHHYAHIAGLMLERNVDDMVGICCDGYGYGIGGEAWGGEILHCTGDVFGFKRVAHLEKQPMIGGDLATYHPLRMAAGILQGRVNVESWLLQNTQHFPHGEKEIQMILQQLERKEAAVWTTSCGRLLDAVSAVLGICFTRTYEGEPSMKLESIALKGKDVLKLEPSIKGDMLATSIMLQTIYENRNTQSTADLAYSAHAYIAKGLAALAIQKASEKNVKTVGFSGGVAYNEILTSQLKRIVEASGLKFVVHNQVPSGDGGLSFGQAVASGFFHS